MLAANSLSLDVRNHALTRRSSRVVPWQLTYERDIEPGERDRLLARSLTACDPKAPLARLRESHHVLARLMAEGKSPVEASAITGYSTDRIYTLKHDPAFTELVHHYETQIDSEKANVTQQVQSLALVAGQILHDRMLDEPESFKNKELMDIMNSGLDRSGHGPQSKVSHTLNDPTKILDSLRGMLSSENRGAILSRAVVDAEFKEVLPDEQAQTRDGVEDSADDA